MRYNIYMLKMKDGSTKEVCGFSYHDAMIGNPNIDVWCVISCEKAMSKSDHDYWDYVYHSNNPRYVRGNETFQEFIAEISSIDPRFREAKSLVTND